MPWPRDLSPCRCIAGSPSYAISNSLLTYWQSAVVYKLTIILYYFSLSRYILYLYTFITCLISLETETEIELNMLIAHRHTVTVTLAMSDPCTSQARNTGIKLFLAGNSSALHGAFSWIMGVRFQEILKIPEVFLGRKSFISDVGLPLTFLTVYIQRTVKKMFIFKSEKWRNMFYLLHKNKTSLRS